MKDANRPRRFVLAGLLAPAAGGLWAGVYFSVAMVFGGGAYQWPPTFLFLLAVTSAYAAIVALALTWSVGLAWHAWANANDVRSLGAYAGFGGGAGAAVALALYLLSNSPWTFATLIGLLWFGSTGAVIAVAGWLIRRPDRDVPPNPPTSAA